MKNVKILRNCAIGKKGETRELNPDIADQWAEAGYVKIINDDSGKSRKANRPSISNKAMSA